MLERVLPQIEYDPDLLEQAPYQVRVNLGNVADLLCEQNMPENDIGKLKIHLRRNHPKSIYHRLFRQHVGGEYDALDKSLTLYTEWAWTIYKQTTELGPVQLPNLAKPDPLLVKMFWEPVCRQSVNYILNRILLHELRHAVDFRSPPKYMASILTRFLASLAGGTALVVGSGQLIDALPPDFLIPNDFRGSTHLLATYVSAAAGSCLGQFLEYKVDPFEGMARRFADEHSQNMRWQALITMSPKNEEPRFYSPS